MLVTRRCLVEVSVVCTGAISLQAPLAPLLAFQGVPPKTISACAPQSHPFFLHAGIIEM